MRIPGYIPMKLVPAYLKAQHNYEIGMRTLYHWLKKSPLKIPVRPNELDSWFHARMREKRERKATRRSQK